VLGEREPDYLVDELDGRLFLLRNESVLEGYDIGMPLLAAPQPTQAAVPAVP